MPVTGIEYVAGIACQICGEPATHVYGNIIICCQCHTGDPESDFLYSHEEARRIHAEVLYGKQVGQSGVVPASDAAEVQPQGEGRGKVSLRNLET